MIESLTTSVPCGACRGTGLRLGEQDVCSTDDDCLHCAGSGRLPMRLIEDAREAALA